MKKLNPTNSGIETLRQVMREHEADYAKRTQSATQSTAVDRIFGEPGKTYPDASAPNYKVEGVLEQIVLNQNELIDKVAALEARPSAPFPAAS
jgi:hypothetical protein